jgi:hypothetical protein
MQPSKVARTATAARNGERPQDAAQRHAWRSFSITPNPTEDDLARSPADRRGRVAAFDEASIAAVLSMKVGEPIAVSGEINAEFWIPEDGSEPCLSWKVTADAVLIARRERRGRDDA